MTTKQLLLSGSVAFTCLDDRFHETCIMEPMG
jgi:hypothetical protein